MKFRFFSFFLMFSVHFFAQNIPLYVGTYTNTNSEGIYSYSFNIKTGELSNFKLVAKTENPSFLAFSNNKKQLYAVSEVNNFNDLNSGFISSYNVHEKGLNLISEITSNGAHPCHISLNKRGTKVAVSNYSGGTISIHSILKNGALANATQVINHNNGGEKSHTHSAKFNKNKLFVADLGLNKLFNYSFNAKNVRYDLKNNYLINENGGPRHLEITKKGKFIYVINELSSSVSVFKKYKKGYSVIQNISTLDEDFKGKSYCADIHLSKNGKFLYGSNRGENSIVVFKRHTKTGFLKKIQTISTEGDWPRNFTLSPDGTHLLVANQKSNNISVYKVNSVAGTLRYLHSVKIDTPACLLF